MGHILQLACLVLAFTCHSGEAQVIPQEALDIANADPCATALGLPPNTDSDNLSCEISFSPGNPLVCYTRTQLCNGDGNAAGTTPFNRICDTGSDEGANIAALDCANSVFSCESGNNVEFDQLCDGNNDCGGGDDESTPLCENKCRMPYYGGCPFTRRCVTSALDVGCGPCLDGFVVDPANPSSGFDCLPVIDINLQLASYNVDEPDLSVTVCAEATGTIGATDSFTATLSTTPQTASTADFGELNPPAVLTFTASQLVDCATIPIVDDIIVENTEFFSVTLASTDVQVQIMLNTASVSINDDDEALFEFTQNTYFGVENVASPPNIPFTIQFASTSGTLEQPVTVTVTSGAGSAIANVDYSPVFVQFTFPAESGPNAVLPLSSSLTDSLDPINDISVEVNENVQLNAVISSGNAAFTPGGNSATVVIQDDDDLVIGFNPLTYQVSEIQGQVQVCFEVRQNNVLAIQGTAILNTQIGSATSQADFVALVNQQVSLPIGTSQASGQFCTPITIQQDGLPENLESFSVLLSSGSPGVVVVEPTEASATVNILGDRIIFEFTQSNYDVSEGDAQPAEVCIELVSGTLSGNTPIQLTPAVGSASAADFTVSPQTLIFPIGSVPGQAPMCIDIPIVDDVLVELLEIFSVAASSNDPNVVEFSPGGAQATVSITDNDVAQFAFTETTYVEGESTGPAQPAIQLIFGELTFPINVDVSTVTGGSATVGSDYVGIPSQRLTFPTGAAPGPPNPQNLMPFNVQIIPDDLVEGDETVNLMANSPSNFAVVNPDSATLIIDDDDQLVVGVEELSYNPLETDDFVEVCILIEDGILDVNVNPALRQFTLDVTATSQLDLAQLESDYTGFSLDSPFNIGTGLLGQTRFCQNINLINDLFAEGPEEFTFNLLSLNNPLISVNPMRAQATVLITDDDDVVFRLTDTLYSTTEGGIAVVMVCVELVSGVLATRSIEVDVDPKPFDPLIDTATLGEDYFAFNAPLMLPLLFPVRSMPGDQECFNVQQFINNDQFVEFLESFRIMLSTNDPSAEFEVGGDCATVNIIDNDEVTIILVPPPGPGLPNYFTPEDSGSQEVCVMIQGGAANVLQRPVIVNLVSSDGAVTPGGAQSPADYGAINSPITFSPGQEGQQICREIPIFDDIICEGEELFNVGLSTIDPGVNLNPLTSSGTVTIIDNDVATISADQIKYVVNEQSDLWINLHLDGQKGPGRECVVSVMTVDGTATDGLDYVGVAGDYVFNSSVFTQLVHLDIIDDRRCEGNETFEVFLSTFSPGCEVGTPQIYVTIVDDEIGGTGDDPHFSIYLPSGEMLCYTVQGEQGFAFNLINNKQLIMNAKFVPDARREEVTWLGSMGMIIRNSNYAGLNDTKLRFEAQEKTVYINDKVALSAKNVEKLTFSDGKMTISEAEPVAGFHYPSLLIDLKDVEVSFTIKYTNQHLDMFWHSTGKKVVNSHGLIGQFFRNGVEIDDVRKILIMPNKEPVPVMRRPVWSFMERETTDDQLCWTAMNSGYQGEGLIDGTYFDYLVDDVMSTDFKFKQ